MLLFSNFLCIQIAREASIGTTHLYPTITFILNDFLYTEPPLFVTCSVILDSPSQTSPIHQSLTAPNSLPHHNPLKAPPNIYEVNG